MITVRIFNDEGELVEYEGEFITSRELFFDTPSRGAAYISLRKQRDPIFAESERARSRVIAARRKRRRHELREQRARDMAEIA